MPTIRIELFEGRSVEMKRALAEEITSACVRVLGGSADGIDVVFHEVARHDWATGGVLWSDKATAPTAPAATTRPPAPAAENR